MQMLSKDPSDNFAMYVNKSFCKFQNNLSPFPGYQYESGSKHILQQHKVFSNNEEPLMHTC